MENKTHYCAIQRCLSTKSTVFKSFNVYHFILATLEMTGHGTLPMMELLVQESVNNYNSTRPGGQTIFLFSQ